MKQADLHALHCLTAITKPLHRQSQDCETYKTFKLLHQSSMAGRLGDYAMPR